MIPILSRATRIVACTILLFGAGYTAAQTTVSPYQLDMARRALGEHGFENLSLFQGECLQIAFENRVYRYDLESVLEVVDVVAPYVPRDVCVALFPLHRGIGVGRLDLSAETFARLADGTAQRADLLRGLNLTLDSSFEDRPRSANRSAGKLDVVVDPVFMASFGNLADPMESTLLIVPTLEVAGWKGMKVSAELILPIQDDLGVYRGLQPGRIVLSQWIKPSHGVVAGARLGRFNENRYGFDLDALARIPGSKRFAFSGRWGYTGFAAYQDHGWLYGDLDRITWEARFHAHVLPQLGFATTISYGSYIYGDRMWRAEFTRDFGETRLGLFASHGIDDFNAGFRIRVPLLFRRHMKPGIARIRSADSFYWGYLYRGMTPTGLIHEPGSSVLEFWGPYEPAVMDWRLSRLRMEQ